MDYVASAVMQKDVKSVPPSMKVGELEVLFTQECVSGFPVVDEGKLVGVVSRTDLLRAAHPEINATLADESSDQPIAARQLDEATTVDAIMTREVVTVDPNDHLHEVADLMYQKRIHRIFVVDDDRLTGIITPFDFVKLYATDRIGVEGRPSRTQDF